MDDMNLGEEKYKQLSFDENMNIFEEPMVCEMTIEERQKYDALVKDATQMNLEDFF
ncbi:MAG: hypothetical protein K6F37_02060 [Lachnospiraceae bacterium]|nr:hypothetical protein [Lachnospiraceae bacterium]